MPATTRLPAALVAELAIAVHLALRGLAHWSSADAPTRSVLARAVPPWDDVWCLLWVAAAPIVAVGLLRHRAAALAAGWVLAATGAAMAFVVAFVLQPEDPRTYVNALWLLFAVWRVLELRPPATTTSRGR